jgi:hypothetical protein
MTPEDKLVAFTQAKEYLTQKYQAHLNECRLSNDMSDHLPLENCPEYPTFESIVALYNEICALVDPDHTA